MTNQLQLWDGRPQPVAAPAPFFQWTGLPAAPPPFIREPAEFLDLFAGYDFGERKFECAESARAAIEHWEQGNIAGSKNALRSFNYFIILDCLKKHINPLIMEQLGVGVFARTPTFAILVSIPSSPNGFSFRQLDFVWFVRPMTDGEPLGHVAHHALRRCREWGMPFTSFWIAQDSYDPLPAIAPVGMVRPDPLLLGKWRRTFTILARW